MSPNLSFQCSLSKAATSRTPDKSLAHYRYQWLLPVVFFTPVRVGLKTIVTGQGAAVGLNGGSCIQSSLERTAFPEPSVRRGMRNRGHNSGMTPVNRKAGTGERTREPPGETPGIFIVLSGFATTDLSVRFCDACQGAEPMENRQRLDPFSVFFFLRTCSSAAYPLNLWIT